MNRKQPMEYRLGPAEQEGSHAYRGAVAVSKGGLTQSVHAKGVITGQAKGARSLRDHVSHKLPSLLTYCAAVRHNRRAYPGVPPASSTEFKRTVLNGALPITTAAMEE